jgi:adenylate kinase
VRMVLLGPPGAGKGTQAARISRERSLVHLSTGDLLRAAVAAGTASGKKAKSYIDQGQLVPDEVVLALLRERLSTPEAREGFLLDGYPRNLAQARTLEREFRDLPVEVVVHLRLADEEIVRRLLLRGRPDDTEPVIRKRLEVYRAETAPLIDHYEKRGVLRTVDALGTVDEIYGRIDRELRGDDGSNTGRRTA